MRTPEEIRHTPVLLLTEEEIATMDPESQEWARNCHAIAKRERECPKHEPVGISTRTGWHSYRCKHCGMDMSWDSGD